jgi:integrase
VLDQRELPRLLRVIDRDDVWQRRFPGRRERGKLMLALFAYAGLRHSELLGLDWDDVDVLPQGLAPALAEERGYRMGFVLARQHLALCASYRSRDSPRKRIRSSAAWLADDSNRKCSPRSSSEPRSARDSRSV